MEKIDSPKQDLQWFSSLSRQDLYSYLHARGDILIGSPQPTLSIDTRCYSGPLHTIRGLASNQIHLLTLPTLSPSAPVGVFFRLSTTKALRLTVIEDAAQIQLSEVDDIALPLGERGVIALSFLAEEQWRSLASYISEDSLIAAHVEPCVALMAVEYAATDGVSPLFTPLPSLIRRENMSQLEITNFHIDRTLYLSTLITTRYRSEPNKLLGEFQLAFVCFHLLGCLKSLEHWTRLLRELCSCRSLDDAIPSMYKKTALVLKSQFLLLSEEIFQVVFRDELRLYLARFVSEGWEVEEVKDFASTANEVMNWMLTGDDDAGDDSDGPVIVDIS